MLRYFFNVHDGHDIPDKDGVLLKGLEEARDQAVTAAGEALRDIGGEFWKADAWRMHVTDEAGATLCTLSFRGTKGDGRG